MIVLNDMGGACMNVTYDMVNTLRAQDHGHPPLILQAFGFKPGQSAEARTLGYEKERSPSLSLLWKSGGADRV